LFIKDVTRYLPMKYLLIETKKFCIGYGGV
jgi:hypothetical protein